MKINFLRFFRFAAICTMLLIIHNPAHAQKVRAAANISAANPLELCNVVTCPSGFATQITTTTPLRSINADMATIEDNGFPVVSYPGYFGINSNWGNLWGIAFSGVNNADITNASGFTIGSTTSSFRETLPLPQWGSLFIGQIANDPDIAVGTCYSTQSSDYEHFALAVYEYNGDIYLEHYEINIQPGNITTHPPAPFICPFPPSSPCAMNVVRVPLSSQSMGTASKPHIEIWHERVNPTPSGLTIATKYAVTWEQNDPHPMDPMNPARQVWAIDGEIDDPGGNFFPTPNQDFLIGDGKQPDVVAVNYFDMTGAVGGFREVAYVTYLNDNRPTSTGRDVMLSDWDYNTQTVNGTITLNTASTANDDEFEVPRISGPMYYDIGAPSPDDPLCVVVVNDNDANSTNPFNKVSAFKYYHSSVPGGPVIEKLDISDHNNADGFSSNLQIAIMPAVTGVGKEVANLAGLTAYDDYPVVFYSDYGGTSDGDFYAFGLKMDVSSNDPELFPPDEYWEVNFPPLDNSSTAFDMVAVRPTIAVATANNSGYDLLTTYYEGDNSDRVMYALTGTAAKYDFKPGKPTAVQQVSQSGIAVYPNPVKDRLNITEADGADYTIMDVTGRSISTGILSGNKAGVDASSLVPGMYILHISKDGHTEQVKFVKQ